MDSLGLQGYVAASGRGTVSGSYSGTLSGPAVTIGFKVCKPLTTKYITLLTLLLSRTLQLSIGLLVLGQWIQTR